MEKVTISRTEAIGRIIELAKEVEIKDTIDWSSVPITEPSQSRKHMKCLPAMC